MKAFNSPWNTDPATILGAWAMLDGLFGREFNANATASQTPTITAATIVAGIIQFTGAPAGGVTATTDTAGNLIAAAAGAFPGGLISRGGIIPIGWATTVRIMNSSGQIVTWTAGSGVLVTGTATVANGSWRDFQMIVTNIGALAAVTFQNMGGGTV